jgi:hypothetical protein
MADDGIIGLNTGLFYSAFPTPSSYTEVTEVIDVNFPEVSVADVKTTHYKTTNGIHDYTPGWKDGATLEVEKYYVAADESTLRGLLGVKKTWKVVLPDGGNYIFGGFMNKIGGAIPNEDRVTIKFSVKICTLPVYAAS